MMTAPPRRGDGTPAWTAFVSRCLNVLVIFIPSSYRSVQPVETVPFRWNNLRQNRSLAEIYTKPLQGEFCNPSPLSATARDQNPISGVHGSNPLIFHLVQGVLRSLL